MDIIRTPNTSFYKRNKAYLIVGFLVLLVALFFQQSQQLGLFSLDKSGVIIATVEQGDFVVKVRAPGVLTPRDVRWISSTVSGRAERVLVKPGAIVQKGDLLIELSNPELERSLEESRWELEAQEAETQAESINLEALLLDQEANVFNAKLAYDTTAMTLKAELSLLESGAQVISSIQHETTKLESKQRLQRWKIEKSRQVKMEQQVKAQKLALTARLEKMHKILQSIEAQVASLKVRASINSVIQDVAIESGQQVNVGGNLAKLAKQGDLIAELQVPELLIKEVRLGQVVDIDTRSNHIQGKVIRIAPAVYDNAVHVDVALIGELPSDARPDLSIDAEVIVSKIENSLFIKRPNFAQSYQKASLFKLNNEGTSASRSTVSLGQGSIQKIEIKEGLKLGDRIIVSEHDELKQFDHIGLN